MKNKEKYRNEILKRRAYECGENICNDFIAPIVLKKYDLYCCDDNNCEPRYDSKISCDQCQMIQSFWLEDEYDEIANDLVDWTKVEKDTPVYVKHKKDEIWKKRYFSHYENGLIYCFPGGRTSWSNNPEFKDIVVMWDYGKLAERGYIEND